MSVDEHGASGLQPGAEDAAEPLLELFRLTDAETARRLDRANEAARSVLDDARREADALVRRAESTADRIVAEARVRAQRLLDGAAPDLDSVISAASPVDGAEPDHALLARLAAENAALAHRIEALVTGVEDGRRPPARSRPLPARRASRQQRRPASGSASGGGRSARSRGVWGRFVYRARWAVLGLGALVTAVSVVWGPAVISSLSNGGFDVAGSESVRAARQVTATFGRQDVDVVAVYRSARYTVGDAAFRKAVGDVMARVSPERGVSAASLWTTNAPGYASTDRHATFISMQLEGDDDQRQRRFTEIRRLLVVDPAVATTQLGGDTAMNVAINDQVGKDLTRAESLSAPALAILLVIVFGSAVAAGLPLLVGGVTVVASFLALRLLAGFTDISVFAVNIVTVLGLGLSIDYALLIVSRFREEQHAGHDVAEALGRTMTTAGRSVAVSATTVAASLLGLLFFPVVFLRSMAYGGVAAVAIAATTSLTVLPAVIAVLGPKVDALRIPWRRRRPPAADGATSTGWHRLAITVMRHPLAVGAGVSAVLLAAAAPVLSVRFGGVDARQLPVTAPSRQVEETLVKDFTRIQLFPITVLVEGSTPAGVQQFARTVSTLPGARSAVPTAQVGTSAIVKVDYQGSSTDAAARDLVTGIRRLTPPPGGTVLVGGYTASQVDLRTAVGAGLWKMGLLAVGVTFLVLFWAFGSVVLPIKAIGMNLLTAGAALGVVVLVFQEGHLSRLLDFTPTGSVELTQPLLVLAILFGVSTDYEVFLLARIRERWDATGDNTESVAVGLQRTGPIITNAAALILVVIVAFSTSKIIFIKLIGVGMFTAILLDATVVRALLVPATMRLLGRWNWWAPGPILRWWERHRPPAEELPPTPEPEPAGWMRRGAGG